MDVSEVTSNIIGAAVDVHRELGPGLLESSYEECMVFELKVRGMAVERQRHLPLTYKGMRLKCGYRLDLVVNEAVVVELKTVEQLDPIHTATVLTYLKISGLRVALLINFNVPLLKHGIRRIIL